MRSMTGFGYAESTSDEYTVTVEIKSALTVSSEFFKGLNMFRSFEPQIPGAFLVMGTSVRQDRSAGLVRGFPQLWEKFEKLAGF